MFVIVNQVRIVVYSGMRMVLEEMEEFCKEIHFVVIMVD